MKINLAKSIMAFGLGLVGAGLIVSLFLMQSISVAQSKQQAPEGPNDISKANVPMALTIVKTIGTNASCSPALTAAIIGGTQVYYCYSITNPGGPSTYLSMTLFDSELGQLTTFSGAFGVGASKFYTFGPITTPPIVSPAAVIISTTQATVAAMRNTNDIVDYATSANAVLTINPINISVSLKKTVGTVGNNTCASTTSINIVQGTSVYYCYTLENTGNVPVRTTSLTDDKISPSPLNSTVYTLQPTAKQAYVSPAQLPSITTTNTATWTVQTLITSPITLTATGVATATVNWRPLVASITLTKTVGTSPSPACASTSTITVLPGTTVYYCYTVVNTGDVTVTSVSLVDNKINGPFVMPTGLLAPRGSQYINGIAATYSVTTTNTATWNVSVPSGPLNGVVASGVASATVNVAPPSPSLDILKMVSLNPDCSNSTDPLSVGPGVNAYYCYTLTNTGGFSLTNVSISDSDSGVLTSPLSIFGVGASTTFTKGPIIKTTVGDNTSTVTWNAIYFNNGISTPIVDNDTATIKVLSPVSSMVLTKTVALTAGGCSSADLLVVAINTSVRYCYTISNTGNTALSAISVSDAQLGAITPSVTTLAPGASTTFFSPAFAASPVGSNVVPVTVTANSSDGGSVNATSGTTLTVTLANPTIKLSIGVSTAAVCTTSDTIYVPSGTSVYYCYTVQNTSSAPHTLTNHSLTTDRFGSVFTDTNISLAPGAVYTYLHPTPVLINQNNRINNGTWTATIQGLPGVSASASENATACLSGVIGNFPCHLTPTAVPAANATATPPPASVIDLVASINTLNSVVVNQPLTINLTVNNAGTGLASIVTLAATLPANAKFQSVTTSGLSCSSIPAVNSTGGSLSCSVPGGLASNASKTINVMVIPTSTTGNAVTLTVATTSAEPNVTNNTQTLNLSGSRLLMPLLNFLLKLIGL